MGSKHAVGRARSAPSNRDAARPADVTAPTIPVGSSDAFSRGDAHPGTVLCHWRGFLSRYSSRRDSNGAEIGPGLPWGADVNHVASLSTERSGAPLGTLGELQFRHQPQLSGRGGVRSCEPEDAGKESSTQFRGQRAA
ncbi:hypothetical protein AAFF_G00044160 [Aldrovandia affinis]|uniref:Uncharacterized protein n=1 Tax=Aldrovandia affinis TaxID=143900 RepID=A0AAD7S2A0_9TELE|nr:hypothetical protein AAFF_G00044160 [Aldrovandia affinis]